MSKKFTRRDFLKSGLFLVSGGIVAVIHQILGCTSVPADTIQIAAPSTDAIESVISTSTHENIVSEKSTAVKSSATAEIVSGPDLTSTQSEQAQTPLSQPSPIPVGTAGKIGVTFPGRVVQTYDPNVHHWDYSDQEYWNYIDQEVVDKMVDQGMMALTGESTIEEAWRSLIPNYQIGEVVAIKVSFNNSHDDTGSVDSIDAIVEPVNAIIRGLKMVGVPNSSIVIYDSSRWIPLRFIDGCDYEGVLYRHKAHDPWGEGSEAIEFNPPNASAFTQQLSKEVVLANYLINVPVLKAHGMTKISMGMKNHYGSIEIPSDLHQWSTIGSPDFSEDYNPMVDINNHAQIRAKTILTLGDSIFAAIGNSIGSLPVRWTTFGNETPKSLFFSTDPVAIDCVMGDTLNQEAIARGAGEQKPLAWAYLHQAEGVGLGVFERGNPWKNTYTKIEFIKLEI